MSIKYGKVLTYKDIEEAKKLIGKKVIASNFLDTIERDYENAVMREGILTNVYSSFEIDNMSEFQFVREVIEEPQYRPFENVDELIEYWEKNYCNSNRPKGTMPLIWVRNKNGNEKALITMFSEEDNAVYLNSEFGYADFEDLFEDWEFLDGSPLGVEVEE